MPQLPPPHAPTSHRPSKGPIYKDQRPKAIAIMTTVGGGVAIIMALVNFVLAFMCCVTIITAPYAIVVGVLCLMKGIPMLTQPISQHRAPKAEAILMIINVVALDIINLTLGIIILVLINKPEVRSQFKT
ncbi:MAG: YccF domain-containing protein [Planctomycetaceae bacterium]|jgi:hypothetical protein|nr:YccF domain-containing protein [Planctomycetaceae bacterium]MBT7253579.1 YccF domain-containing protein [Planctomycetaceae bacterium]